MSASPYASEACSEDPVAYITSGSAHDAGIAERSSAAQHSKVARFDDEQDGVAEMGRIIHTRRSEEVRRMDGRTDDARAG